MNKDEIKAQFPKVLSLVEDGFQIYQALNKLNISRAAFYKAITERQKAQLGEANALKAQGSRTYDYRK